MSARTVPAAAVVGAAALAAVLAAAPAGADEADENRFRAAIAALRAAGPCGPLRPDPTVAHVAALSNRSTRDYLDHTARHVPVDDPLPVLHDLGDDAGTAIQVQGFGPDPATAINGALLQADTSLTDCSFDRVGTSVLTTADGTRVLAVAVLAGR
ncbi:hypothetical protein H7J77_13375 [Mycolicibacillus parakoreensis]|uniref:CAP domain-containing protein n=1 Tax=Mycolicibacillus parakoreensis TaxID=1069221 RepID=A0ABY3TYH1_9MYCO|nr:hypothetical protein [Mycolicibacillus parakoreensis]MCV7316529.1 hypothetical protein [Mycolicibacillus parakoreensis]ULN52754.1 hypothetical protein MIU77_18360 [Mycolicibacillus parakoreensis]HLR98352.1 hypothetical protein [Mycolicibacillus parakoreensis]